MNFPHSAHVFLSLLEKKTYKLEKKRRRGLFDVLGTVVPSDPAGTFYIADALPG